MKNMLQHKLSKMQKSILFLVLFSFIILLYFVLSIQQGKAADSETIIIEIFSGTIAFVIIAGLLYKLNKSLKEVYYAKDDLAANELKYRNLIENAGIVMYTTSLEGLITFSSSKAFELTGYSPNELSGMHFSEFIDADWIEEVKRKYKNQVKNRLEETLVEFCIRTKFGDLKWVEQSAVLLFQDDLPVGFQCIIKDISEKKEMEEVVRKYEIELVQNQERLQSILDNATSSIHILDLNGNYLLINKQFEKIFGLSEENIIGKTAFDFTNMELAQRLKDTDAEVIRQCKPRELEVRIDMPDGKHNILFLQFPLINAQNKVYGIGGIGTDITERVRYQEELIKAKKIAEDAQSLQEQFLANMSHEIRTPMNGIQGMTDLLLETKLTEEQEDFAKTIKRSSDNLVVIINDILDFSKIKAGKLTIEKIDFDLNEVLENIKAIFMHSLKEKALKLQLGIDEDVPNTLNGDPYRLNQILVNLVGNAIKFTHKGEIKINISMERKSGNEIVLHFSIADTGIGIESDKINKIFESFTQANVGTSRKYGGSGLGLTITRQLIEMQNGKISVASKINSGTTFQFSIPYGYSKTNNQLFFRSKELKNYHSFLKGKRFLVAEDNEVNQKVIRRVLQKAGGEADVANNGLGAISLLKKCNDYDIIIMDLQMPEMDGYAATKYIRNVMNLSIPIIAMTASALKGEKIKCIEMGMNDYITKPFDFSLLYERLSLLLEDKSLNNSIHVAGKPANDKLFDLSLLEEMDDNDYMTEILSLFLNNTPVELNELQHACDAGQSKDVYKIAHKLKSSTGLFKANELLHILIKIEENSKTEKYEELGLLIKQAREVYKKIETPLREHLKETQKVIRLSV